MAKKLSKIDNKYIIHNLYTMFDKKDYCKLQLPLTALMLAKFNKHGTLSETVTLLYLIYRDKKNQVLMIKEILSYAHE